MRGYTSAISRNKRNLVAGKLNKAPIVDVNVSVALFPLAIDTPYL